MATQRDETIIADNRIQSNLNFKLILMKLEMKRGEERVYRVSNK